MWPFTWKIKNFARARDKPTIAPSASAYFRPVFRTRADGQLRGNEAIYAAVSRISNAMASMPMHLYRGNELMADHPLERLVSLAPNDNFSPFGFVQTMEAYRNIEGCAYALIVTDGLGAVKRLDILDPARVMPKRHPKTGEMWYEVFLEEGKSYPLPGCQLITLRHMSANGEIGIKPIDVLTGTLNYDRQVKEYGLKQLDGVNSGVFLTVPGSSLSEEAKKRVVAQFLDAYESSGGRVVVLEGGLTATTFSNSPVSAQVLDVERITRNRVATVYNIPPHLLGDYTDTSFSTAEQQMQEFLQLTITPIVVQWEQELNRKLLSEADYRAGYRFRFDVDAILRADTQTRADLYQKAIRAGWLKPNEVREREGRAPDPNGGELMASRDLIPLRIAIQHPELLLSGKQDSTAEPNPDEPGKGGKP